MKVVLIPCPIAEQTAAQVLPEEVRQYILACRHYLVENIRTARRFISELKLGIDIESLQFEILDKDSQRAQIKEYFKNHSELELIGVMSEAGCPGVADPGALAVSIAQEEGIEVIPLVGPSSILLALMGSGFSGQSFCFHGYLPIDKIDRAKRIDQLTREVVKSGQTQMFIETPFRNESLLEHLLQLLPSDMRIAIGCELTSPQGYIQTKTAKEWAQNLPSLHKKPCIFLLGK